MEFRRRRVLRAGALAALGSAAGCLGGRDSPDGSGETPVGTTTDREPTTTRGPSGTSVSPSTDRTTTDRVSSIGTTRTVAGDPVTVAEAMVRDSVFYLPFPDELGVRAAEGRRYVFVLIEAPYGGPDRSAFELVADAGRFQSGLGFPRSGLHDPEPVYGGDDEAARGWLGFRVPAPLETGSLRVRVGNAVWRIPDRYVDRLRSPKPAFELVEFAVPETVEANDTIDVAATFRNAGDRSGTLRAAMALHGGGFPCCAGPRTTMEISAGGRETWRESLGGSGPPRSGAGEVRIRLKSPAGNRERSVTVNRPTTTGSTTTEGG